MAGVSRYALVIILLFVALISGTNCQSTADDGSCGVSDDGLGALDVITRQHQVIVNKLDKVEAAVNTCRQQPCSVEHTSAHVEALKCKRFILFLLYIAGKARSAPRC